MDNLLLKNKKLQKEVKNIVLNSGILECLENLGKARVVGSAKYSLMTWRDLDFDLVVKKISKDKSFWKLVRKLFNLKGIKLITLIDNQIGDKEKNRPKSVYIGLKYQMNNNDPIWKIDIRILEEEDVVTDKIDLLISQKLTEQSKLKILEIKSEICNDPNYHKEFSSVNIYESVLNENINTLEQFKKYLNKKL